MSNDIPPMTNVREADGMETFFDRFGLSERYMLLPMISAPLTGLTFFLFAGAGELDVMTMNRHHVELILFLLMVGLVIGMVSIPTGLPGWLAGWVIARRLRLGRWLASIVASGFAAFSGVACMMIAMKLRYGLTATDMRAVFGMSMVAVPVAMIVGAWLFAGMKNDVRDGSA